MSKPKETKFRDACHAPEAYRSSLGRKIKNCPLLSENYFSFAKEPFLGSFFAFAAKKGAAKFNFLHLHFPYFPVLIKLYLYIPRKDDPHAIPRFENGFYV
ncbi:hypothetical protein [Anoxybacillus flavithermus]|nr:hypothetical protein [Anoxybacillus flavithermus]